MTINQHIPSYETCLKLRDAGFKSETIYVFLGDEWLENSQTKHLVENHFLQLRLNVGRYKNQAVPAPLLSELLYYFYNEEQNIELSSFFDGGWYAKAGDTLNGFIGEQENNSSPIECVAQLWIKIFGKEENDEIFK